MEFICTWHSPLGELTLRAGENALIGISFDTPVKHCLKNPVLQLAEHWLEEYFSGKPVDPAQLPLAPTGTVFQHRVWELLLQIPYGKTVTYGEIARKLSPVMSARAVGNAVGANPLPIVIPCHRVLAANGIGGYSEGLAVKRQLLAIEKIVLPYEI